MLHSSAMMSRRAPFRKIARDINEDARDHARSLKGTPEFEQSRDARKKVEMRFCAPQDPPSLRAHAVSAGPLRRTRRVPSRGHRAEPQDARKPHLASTTEHAGCVRGVNVSCVRHGWRSVNVIPLQPGR